MIELNERNKNKVVVMKKKNLLKLLMIPALFIGVSFGMVAANVSSNQNFVQIRADSPELTAFLTRFNEIRTLQNANGKTICDTTKEEYEELVNLYSALTKAEQTTVNQTPDQFEANTTIGDMMKEIIRIHYNNHGSNEAPKAKLDQSTTIIIAAVVSIFGMSAISVLFILKNNKYIEQLTFKLLNYYEQAYSLACFYIVFYENLYLL